MFEFDPRQVLILGAAIFRDHANRLSYGGKAPKVAETIWVRPSDVDRYVCAMPNGLHRRNASGRVIDFEALKIKFQSLSNSRQIRACYQRWCNNIPWDETDEFAAILRSISLRGRSVRCRNEGELRARYRLLDEIFEEVSRTRRLRTRKQLTPFNFRECGGIQIAIDPQGRPVLGNSGGFHRIAIAKILEIDVIPAELGLVDVNALHKLERYRLPPPVLERDR